MKQKSLVFFLFFVFSLFFLVACESQPRKIELSPVEGKDRAKNVNLGYFFCLSVSGGDEGLISISTMGELSGDDKEKLPIESSNVGLNWFTIDVTKQEKCYSNTREDVNIYLPDYRADQVELLITKEE